MEKYLGLKDDGTYYAAKREAEFLNFYEKNWSEILSDTYYKSEQLDIGHKFRPRLVYWGFIMNGCDQLTNYDFDMISKVAVCIELVHKASILLDDFIDQDTARHGKPTFHTIHGIDRTVICSLNILSRSLKILNHVFYLYSNSNTFIWKSMNAFTTTLEEMTLGVLKEPDLPDQLNQNINVVREIMHLETSALITNSLLMGMYLAQIDNSDAIKIIERIGKKFGFIFQALNDLEPFCNLKNSDHKGSINTDFSRSRKNICVSLLYPFLSSKEVDRIKSNKIEIQNDLIIKYFKKYQIYESIMNELNNTYASMLTDINELQIRTPELDQQWPSKFTKFVSSVITICKNRVSD